MRRQNASLVDLVINPFMVYLAPQPDDSFASGLYASGSRLPTFNSEKLSLLIFIIALAFIAVISPILCFGSLFIEIHLEGLWYFWLITISEVGYSVWLIMRKRVKKAAD